MRKILVTGASGFIGGHLCAYLKKRDYFVRVADYTFPRYGELLADEHMYDCDLRYPEQAARAVDGMDWVFHLAADMGGVLHSLSGDYDKEIIRNNTLIDINMANAADVEEVERFLFSSSACIYPTYLQDKDEEVWLKESDAYPALSDHGYGWEKLHMEHICKAYQKDSETLYRIARLHNVFGPMGAFTGGREKAPAAFCRRISEAKLSGRNVIEMLGDGGQKRSFCFISDALEMLYRLMKSDFRDPLNVGTDETVSINQLAQTVMDIADYQVEIKHIEGPQGVRSRSADLSLMRETLDYSPQVSLKDGLAMTYPWIAQRVKDGLENALVR